MARLLHYQTSFADGQISKKLRGFVDTDSYKSSVQDLKNMVVMPQGSITRRPGTRYVTTTSGNCSVRLVPFNFGQDQAYVLEFGEETFTGTTTATTSNKLVFATGGFTARQHSLVGATVTNTTDSTSTTISAVDSNTTLSVASNIFTNGENFSIAHKYVRFYKNNAQLLTGGNPYAIVSPYGTADLDALNFTQSADILFIAHPSYQPRQLIRSGDTSWAFDYVNTTDGPYLSINHKESATLTASGTLTSVDVGNPQVDITDHFFQLANHDLLDGMAIKMALKSGGSTFPKYHVTDPSGTGVLFDASTTYYVTNATSTTFQLAKAVGDKPVYLRERNDEVEIKKQIYPKGKAVTLKVGDGTSALWTNSGSKTKGGIVTYTATSGAVTPSDGSSDLLFTDTGHGLVNDDRIQFRHASGALPGGIVESLNYYVKKINDNTFNISLTPSTGANTTINYDSSAGSNVSWYKDPLFYTCIATHTATANNYPGSALGNDSWEILDINEGRGFEHYDVDTYVRYNPLQGAAISWGNVQVDSVTNALTITATVKEDLVAAGPNHEWRKYAWNSDAGWPRTVEIFQQRMCFGGNNDNPQTVWFSKTGDFFNFSPSEKIGVASGNVTATGARVVGEQVKDDNAITLTISSATVDLIDWMISGKKLSVGTSGGVFQMYGSETEVTMTPFNFTIDRVTSHPSDTNAYPLIIDNNVLYVQKNGRKMRDVAFTTATAEGNQANDLSIRADDILVDNVKEIVYQDQPYNIVWCRLNSGKLASVTYNKALNMMAWSNHAMGGTNAVVESLAVVPTSTHHQLWMVVRRTVNSASVRYVEYMDRYFDSGEMTSDEAHYVDSGIYTTGSGVTNLSGLNHLEGETVRILADSAVQTDKTVASGAVTIASADKIHAGLSYDSFVTTLDLAEGPDGVLVGNRKKIHRIVVKMLDSMGLVYGPSETTLDEMIFRYPTDNLGEAVAYFTGDEVLTMGNMTYGDHNIVIGQNGPFPLSILMIGFDYESNDL